MSETNGLKLEVLDVVEMTPAEMRQIQGGAGPLAPVAIALGALLNVPSFASGFQKGWSDTRSGAGDHGPVGGERVTGVPPGGGQTLGDKFSNFLGSGAHTLGYIAGGLSAPRPPIRVRRP